MLDRLLFRFRKSLPSLGRLLGSWKLSIVLMVALVEWYLLLAIWANTSAPAIVRNIAGLLVFWAAYLLLMVNTGVCLWRRIPGLKRDITVHPMEARRTHRWELRLETPLDASGARRELRAAGLRVRPRAAGGLWGRRQRWAGLGTYFFHLSLYLVALGFILSLYGRHESRFFVASGETFEGLEEQFLSRDPLPAFGAPPEPVFLVDDIRVAFWRTEFLFTELQASLAVKDLGFKQTRINDPIWLRWDTFLRLSGVGYAPRYELNNTRGETVSSAFSKVNAFPPGTEGLLLMEGFPHRVYLSIEPHTPDPEAGDAGGSMALVRPRVSVRVYRGRLGIAQADLLSGESVSFEGLELSFPEIRYWGEFSMVRDPGFPVLFLGYLFGLLGLLLKIRGKRGEMVWIPGSDGAPDVLRGWGSAEKPAGATGRTVAEDAESEDPESDG